MYRFCRLPLPNYITKARSYFYSLLVSVTKGTRIIGFDISSVIRLKTSLLVPLIDLVKYDFLITIAKVFVVLSDNRFPFLKPINYPL